MHHRKHTRTLCYAPLFTSGDLGVLGEVLGEVFGDDFDDLGVDFSPVGFVL